MFPPPTSPAPKAPPAPRPIAPTFRRAKHRAPSLLLLGFLALAPAGRGASEPTPSSDPVTPARELLARLLPRHTRDFVFERIPPDPQGDVFEIEGRGRQVVVRGNTGVALASGLNWYLKHHAHCHVSWCGQQLALPDPLPPVPERVRRVSPFRWRYCFNYCAFSYSLAFWDWPQWERMIDWMALHGINFPLAVTGQEAVWQSLGHRLGLTDADLARFFVGPGFLPFGWMGCLDGWAGPLPQSWIRKHAELARRILDRERALGMTPVLQGFTGHVPAALTNVCPGVRLRQLPKWAEFPPTSFVDPQDPFFVEFGSRFVAEQTHLFGTDHYYAADTFIEMPPPSNDPAFLAAMGRAVFEGMRAADPDAVWVLQGWLFVNAPQFWQPPQGRALFGAVPDDRLVALDLFCESTPVWSKTEAFYGKPWIWCVIQNFGGTVSLHGALPRMADDLRQAMTGPDNGRLRGVGLIFEGRDYNPIVQDFLTDMIWRDRVPDLDDWCRGFVRRRYGTTNPAADNAWRLLRQTAYRETGRNDTALVMRPSRGSHSWGSGRAAYEPADLIQAADQLLAAADTLGRRDTYQFDLVNVTRQVLGDLAGTCVRDVELARQQTNRAAFDAAGRSLCRLADDIDALLATRPEFLLGRWLADARRWADTRHEARLYEWNARNLITLWGPPDSVLHDYASRQWSGMFRDFYRPRWERYIAAQRTTWTTGTPFDPAAFEADLRRWEDRWGHGTERYSTRPKGNPVAVARRLIDRYRPTLQRAIEPDVPSLTTGKPVSTSHALPDAPARLANDGRRDNTDRYWATDVATAPGPAWWQVDFEEPTTVGRVVVVGYYGDSRFYGFTVEASTDGQHWDLLADRRANRDPSTAVGYTCPFPPRPVRYLRITQTLNSANTGRHLVEVMAYPQ